MAESEDDPGEVSVAPDDPVPAQFPTFLLSLFDETNVRILRAAAEAWLSVREIAETAEVPQRACYRRVNDLYRSGLLRLREDHPPRRGRPVKRYKSSLGNVQVVLSGSDYQVSLEWPEARFDLSVEFP